MDSSYLGQIKRALGFEEKLHATLVAITREHGKANFTYKHTETGKLWRTTLVKLEKYGHNKFSKLSKVKGSEEVPMETKGELMGSLKTREEVLVDFVATHGDRYDYTNVIYVNSKTKVEIICEKHGSFWQRPPAHKVGKGCSVCVGQGKRTLQQVLAKFVEVHLDKYDYSLVSYVNEATKVRIICQEHGEFTQSPNKHKMGRGCPKCGIQSMVACRESTGWGYTEWEVAGNTSKVFDSFKVYIIECWNDNERFIKIGKTFRSVFDRFSKPRDMPYNYKILKVIEGDAREISELEIALHRLNKEYSCEVTQKFSGSTECFSELKEETFCR